MLSTCAFKINLRRYTLVAFSYLYIRKDLSVQPGGNSSALVKVGRCRLTLKKLTLKAPGTERLTLKL